MSRCARCPCPVYTSGGMCYNCVGMETTPSSCNHIPCINCTMLICVEHAGFTPVEDHVCVSCSHVLNMMLVDGVHPRRHTTLRAPTGIYTPKYVQPRPPLTFNRAVHTRQWDDQECVICAEQFRVDGPDITKLGCGHPFHVRCVSEWAKVKKTCPTCRNFFGRAPHSSVIK
jgi:hypothetical protein